MYVGRDVYMYVCSYIHISHNMHAYIHFYVCMHVCTHVYRHMCACIYINAHITHIHMYGCMDVHACTCICAI